MSSLTAVRSPGVLRALSLAAAARLPLTTIGVLILLQARHLGLSYALGGLATGAFALGFAAGSPLLGRLVDKRGQTPVLHLSGLVAGVAITAVALVPPRLAGLVIPLAALVGLSQPPVTACVRAMLTRLLAGRDRDFVLVVDVSANELVFMLGPLGLLSLAVAAGPPVALAVTGLGLTLATSAFAVGPETRAMRGESGAGGRRGRGVIAHPGVLTLVVVTGMLGAKAGAVEVAIVVADEKHHGQIPLPILFFVWALGSLIGGVLAARRLDVRDRTRAMHLLLLGTAVPALLAAIPLPEWWLIPCLALTGLSAAPLIALLYAMMSNTAPAGALTEAYAWEMTGMTAGAAMGSAAAGFIATFVGVGGVFIAAAAAALAGSFVWGRRSSTVNDSTPLHMANCRGGQIPVAVPAAD